MLFLCSKSLELTGGGKRGGDSKRRRELNSLLKRSDSKSRRKGRELSSLLKRSSREVPGGAATRHKGSRSTLVTK